MSRIYQSLLRQSQWQRSTCRYASTTSAASNAASNVTSQASQGLTRVTSTAGAAMGNAGQAASRAINSVGGTTGRVVNFAQSLVPPTMYYARVGLEMGKLVAHGRKMAPPDMATFQSHFRSMMQSIRTPMQASKTIEQSAQNMNAANLVQRMRNMDNQQMINVGVIAAEVIGFFTVGEIIGRMKMIGYSSSTHGHGAHVIPSE